MPGEWSDAARPFALYPLRIGLAAVFVVAGWNKLTGFAGWSDFLASQGVPLATVTAGLVVVAELFGGLGILLGVLTRFSSAVLTVVLLAAIYMVQWSEGFVGGWNFDLALIAGLVTLAINGPGRPTIWTALDRLDLSLERRLARRLPGSSVGEGESVA